MPTLRDILKHLGQLIDIDMPPINNKNDDDDYNHRLRSMGVDLDCEVQQRYDYVEGQHEQEYDSG